MSTVLQSVRGTHDLLPEQAAQHLHVANTARTIAKRYGCGEIMPPMFEFTSVFHRTLGDASDVVSKETYTFDDRGGESLTLRPEFTASIARAFLSHGMQQSVPAKFFYYGPAFRYERPQKGRLRQFHQIGVEVMGASEVESDLEVLLAARHMLDAFGLLPCVTLEINSLGDAESRANYREALVAYLNQHADKLSDDSKQRLEKNPLRILDSKSEADKAIIANAPTLAAYFTPEATARFETLKAMLTEAGVTFSISPTLVRGLDYYCHTVFEFTTDKLGAQGTVLAGGRYDQLMAMMGGNVTPSIGFAAGVERLVALMEAAGTLPQIQAISEVAVVPMGEAEEAVARRIAHKLRAEGHNVELAYKGNAGKRLKRADKVGCKLAVIVGADEMRDGTVSIKHLQSGRQETVAMATLSETLRNFMA